MTSNKKDRPKKTQQFSEYTNSKAVFWKSSPQEEFFQKLSKRPKNLKSQNCIEKQLKKKKKYPHVCGQGLIFKSPEMQKIFHNQWINSEVMTESSWVTFL